MTQDRVAGAFDRLQTEAVDGCGVELGALSSLALAEMMNGKDAGAVAAVSRALPSIASAIDAISERASRGGRLIYVGAGTSGRLGVLDAVDVPSTFGTDDSAVLAVIAGGASATVSASEGDEDSPGDGVADLVRARPTADDVVVGITSSGRTPYVLGAMAHAARVGALTVGISCNVDAPLSGAVEHGIEIAVGPELLVGSTRLGAGTATKIILNMISTIVMIRLGKTYRSLMVDVKVNNEKLEQRAIRMVTSVTGVERAAARDFLESSQWQAKTAIAMIETGMTASDARAALDAARGSLGSVIDR